MKQERKQRTMRKLRDYALYLLNRRDHTARELQDKCLGKGYDPEEVRTLIHEFQEQRWLDDARFAGSYVRQLILARKSRRQIEESLRRKGIDPVDYREALEEGYSKELEEELINRHIDRYLRGSKPPEREKIIARLVSRGFAFGAVKNCLDKRLE